MIGCVIAILPACAANDRWQPSERRTETGAASCVAASHCPCEVYRDFTPMRGAVREVGDGRALVEVAETWGPADDLVAGDHVGGEFDNAAMCGGVAYTPVVGDDVLALYQRGGEDHYPICLEYQDCAEVCGPVPMEDAGATEEERVVWDRCDEGCIADTRDGCRLRRPDALRFGSIALAAWEEVAYLGDGPGGRIEFPLADIEMFVNKGQECREALPAGEPVHEPCDDTEDHATWSAPPDDAEGP